MKRLLDPDPQRERARQMRLLDIAERRFTRVYADELDRLTLEMVAAYARTGSAPNVPSDAINRMSETFIDVSGMMVQTFGGRVLSQAFDRSGAYTFDGKSVGFAGGDGRMFEVKFFAELFQRLALQYIQAEAVRRRIVGIVETTRANVVAAIDRGQRAGLGVDQIAKDITENSPIRSRTRAHIIARTETHGAANYGANEAAKATGLKLKKEWVSVQDHRTRDFGQSDGILDDFDHRSANGQIVDMDQPFVIAGKSGQPEMLMYPGDPNGSPGNTINCRCGVSHIVDDGF